MRLGARKARHLDVSEVIIFRVIRSPSLDVIASVGAAIRNGGMILRFSFSWPCKSERRDRPAKGLPCTRTRALIVSQGTDCFNQIQNARLDVGQALRDTQPGLSMRFRLRKMTRITYLHGSPSETEPIRLCRRKAMEYQRTALTTTDPTVRRKYLHLAELWREMADEAKRRMNASSQHEGKGVVLFLTDFKGRRV